jgi:hypothetical protein
LKNQETFNDIFDIYGISILSGTLRLGGARSKSWYLQIFVPGLSEIWV